jgi:hypothetical protein
MAIAFGWDWREQRRVHGSHMHVSTAERNQVWFQLPSRSTQERSNQQHGDVCTSSVKCWLQ